MVLDLEKENGESRENSHVIQDTKQKTYLEFLMARPKQRLVNKKNKVKKVSTRVLTLQE